MSNVQVFKNELFEVAVRENAMNIELDVEAVARNLGFVRIQGEKTYVRWERVNGYLKEIGYAHSVGKGDYILEQYVYMLAMKGENDLALAFQKFLAFDVIPQIRKKKVYIDPSATDKEIDAAVRFATPQKRRTALLEATIDGKNSVFAVYDDIKTYISKWTADEKITTLLHIERVLLDKQDTYGKDVAFIHKIEELLRQVAKDLDKLKNWKNGAEKRELSKENKQLKDKIETIIPSVDKMNVINRHGFSENYMYYDYDLASTGEFKRFLKAKTDEYANWIEKFPFAELPSLFDLKVDFNYPVELIVYFDHKSEFDVINLDKSLADMLAYHYRFNDKVIVSSIQRTNRYIDTYKDGKIYWLLRNI
ncbi:hypothetical protein [Paenibacillus sp. sgz302251]|uniref:hypothetical protein n=1 Tax=Paenibacillus sp. sgz302251 TaxID=3414493 RepID=UPI003C7E8509